MRALPDLRVAVVGSVNLDLVAPVDRLPAPGETVLATGLARYPGGKGANQALAARRLGAAVRLVARVGDDPEAGLALSAGGENQIVVVPGANARLASADFVLPPADVLICQLEVPVAAVAHAAARATGLVCLNLAPAAAVPPAPLARADLVVVNAVEAAALAGVLAGWHGTIATTLGSAGAVIVRGGVEIARVSPPRVAPVDATGAGDAFTAALALAVAAGHPPAAALAIACATGALATTRAGAQPALPWCAEVAALAGLPVL